MLEYNFWLRQLRDTILDSEQKVILLTLQWVRDEKPNQREVDFVMKELMNSDDVTVRSLERFRTVKVVGS